MYTYMQGMTRKAVLTQQYIYKSTYVLVLPDISRLVFPNCTVLYCNGTICNAMPHAPCHAWIDHLDEVWGRGRGRRRCMMVPGTESHHMCYITQQRKLCSVSDAPQHNILVTRLEKQAQQEWANLLDASWCMSQECGVEATGTQRRGKRTSY